MNLVWIGLGAVIAWYFLVRHEGNFKYAFEEIREISAQAFGDYVLPYITAFVALVRKNWIASLLVVLVAGLVFGFLIVPALQPQEVLLQWGENIMVDNCGNPVTFWIVSEYTALEEQRIEVVPDRAGTDLELAGVLKPGQTFEKCKLTIPLQ